MNHTILKEGRPTGLQSKQPIEKKEEKDYGKEKGSHLRQGVRPLPGG